MFTVTFRTQAYEFSIDECTRDDAYTIADVLAKSAMDEGIDAHIIIADEYHADITSVSMGMVCTQLDVYAA